MTRKETRNLPFSFRKYAGQKAFGIDITHILAYVHSAYGYVFKKG